jgi:hypothetical protein
LEADWQHLVGGVGFLDCRGTVYIEEAVTPSCFFSPKEDQMVFFLKMVFINLLYLMGSGMSNRIPTKVLTWNQARNL